MLEASCHCGAVRIEIDDELPTQLTSCNCSICHRLGTLWTYHDRSKVRVTGTTAIYCWGDKMLDLHHCPTCACVTHWWNKIPTEARMGVNARLLPRTSIEGIRIRRLDGADTWKFLD